MTRHRWPGNVRELANVIEHAAILCDVGPDRGWSTCPAGSSIRTLTGPQFKTVGPADAARDRNAGDLSDRWSGSGGNKPKVAEELGISLKTLYNKLNQSNSLDKSA